MFAVCRKILFPVAGLRPVKIPVAAGPYRERNIIPVAGSLAHAAVTVKLPVPLLKGSITVIRLCACGNIHVVPL